MVRRDVVTFLLVTLIPVVLVEVKTPCDTLLKAPGVPPVEVLNITSSLNVIHCKGAEYNVSLTVVNKAGGNSSGFIVVDGWDPEIGLHVTSGLLRVDLKPGEIKTLWIMLPIDTREAKNYYFNATFVPQETGLNAAFCGKEENIPLYKYLLLLVTKR